MAQQIREVMTANPVVLRAEDTVAAAARAMREQNIGAVLMENSDAGVAIVTDRDIVVRAIAEGRSPESTPLLEIASAELVTVEPRDEVETALTRMRERSVRRLAVLDHGRPVGIVSLGDLAIERGEGTVLADVSAAKSNR